uniref:Uncharacterized protein n=1 Tax=Echinococcus canadensis TaxID=519352 RepID=A0A915EY63_9CEST
MANQETAPCTAVPPTFHSGHRAASVTSKGLRVVQPNQVAAAIEVGGQPGNQSNRGRGQAVAGANFSGASSYRSEEGDCRFGLHLKCVNYLTTQVWRVETRDTKETASNRLVQKLVTLPSQ